jgi:ABC-type branched-subunit amino acid transport system ATPase component
MIECRQVTKSFGGVHALRGIDLTIDDGVLMGLVGPNGSGKSTLINTICGEFRPTSGSILFEGRDVHSMPSHRIRSLGIARTYQIPRPFMGMTVRENVAVSCLFGTEKLSPPESRTRADEFLDFAGLTPFADAYPREVNLHQRHFLELARALAAKPKVLFLDEVFAGLTPSEIEASAALIRRIHASGVTIVLVEHIMRLVMQLAERLVVLAQGQVLADADPATVVERDEVIAAYLGRSYARDR